VKNKKWLLLLIIAFPSFFWLILESSTINSRRLPYYGPRSTTEKGDTAYHTAGTEFVPGAPPLFALCFISDQYRTDAYRLTGVWEYLTYKKDKIRHIPLVLVVQADPAGRMSAPELEKLKQHQNVSIVTVDRPTFERTRKDFFLQKPYYIDYSFFVLVDPARHIRGYYDARYVAEIKRLIEEYQHLRLKEEKQKMIQTNEIKTQP
jgi:hypothetical protein